MGKFADTMRGLSNFTLSENGGRVVSTTGGGALLDLFAQIGSIRDKDMSEVCFKWLDARRENEELADNLVLYARDIRNGGCGERKVGRELLSMLATVEPKKVIRNFDRIVACGRWDDLFEFIGNPEVEPYMWEFIAEQFYKDVKNYSEGKPISLLCKWLKSPNTSSKESRQIAKTTYKALGLTEAKYRKALAKLRKYTNVVERTMSDREWDSINFEAVPSIAMSRYQNCFKKNCPENFNSYMEALFNGEAKVNAGAITPTTICEKFLENGGETYWDEWSRYGHKNGKILTPVDEAQWDALPNYVEGENDVVIMADISGSMQGKPLAASVGLASYFAQRNKGAYSNLFMTFAGDPKFVSLADCNTAEDCFIKTVSGTAAYNTNMDKAFKAIYDVAVETRETPKAIVVVSDGEMDRWVQDKISDDICSKWNSKLIAEGLNPIKVISWNVAARNDTHIAPASQWVSFCSGSSAGNFSHLIELINYDGYEAMVKILSKPQFQWK